MMEFIPAPLKRGYYFATPQFIEVLKSQWQVAVMLDQGGTEGTLVALCGIKDDPGSEFCGQLFAASPDLLAACEALLAAGPYGNADAYNTAVDLARGAIEKARRQDPREEDEITRCRSCGQPDGDGSGMCDRCYND